MPSSVLVICVSHSERMCRTSVAVAQLRNVVRPLRGDVEGLLAPQRVLVPGLRVDVDRRGLLHHRHSRRVRRNVGALVERKHVGESETARELLVGASEPRGRAGCDVPAFLVDTRGVPAAVVTGPAEQPHVPDRHDDRR